VSPYNVDTPEPDDVSGITSEQDYHERRNGGERTVERFREDDA
jgi:hypothetical protein